MTVVFYELGRNAHVTIEHFVSFLINFSFVNTVDLSRFWRMKVVD